MRPSKWRNALAAALALAGCGAEVTVLNATGPFEELAPESFRATRTDVGTTLELTLSQAGTTALITIALVDDEAPCWRSKRNQHACTLAGEAGVIGSAQVQAGDRTCRLDGWVERLDDTWQLDVHVAAFEPCAGGRLAAIAVR